MSASVIQATPLSVPPVWLLAGKPLLNVENETTLVVRFCAPAPPRAPRGKTGYINRLSSSLRFRFPLWYQSEFLSLSVPLVFPSAFLSCSCRFPHVSAEPWHRSQFSAARPSHRARSKDLPQSRRASEVSIKPHPSDTCVSLQMCAADNASGGFD